MDWIFRWDDMTCALQWGAYAEGRLALRLVDAGTKEPLAIASLNVPAIPLDADELILKDYSENAGLLEALLNAGLVTLTSRAVRIGQITAPIVRVNPLVLPGSSTAFVHSD